MGTVTTSHTSANVEATSATVKFTASGFSHSNAQKTSYESGYVTRYHTLDWYDYSVGVWTDDPSNEDLQMRTIIQRKVYYYYQDWEKYDYGGLQYEWTPEGTTPTATSTSITFNNLTAGTLNTKTASVDVTLTETIYTGTSYTTTAGSRQVVEYQHKTDATISPWRGDPINQVEPTSLPWYSSLGRPSDFYYNSTNTISVGSASASVNIYTKAASGFSYGAQKDVKIYTILTQSTVAAWCIACDAYLSWYNQSDHYGDCNICKMSSGARITASWYNTCIQKKTGQSGTAVADKTYITADIINALNISYD